MKSADSTLEKELIRSYLEGNLSSLQKLIKKYENRLFSYIFMLVKDKQLADDIFQETFIKVINTLNSGRYNDEGKFIQWAMRIAHNLVIDHFRKSKKVSFVENRYEESDVFENLYIADKSIEDVMVTNQIFSDVKKLMDSLPDDQREVLYLRCYAGLSFKDIADQTEVSINTALGRMRYALINIRKMIEEKNLILTT